MATTDESPLQPGPRVEGVSCNVQRIGYGDDGIIHIEGVENRFTADVVILLKTDVVHDGACYLEESILPIIQEYLQGVQETQRSILQLGVPNEQFVLSIEDLELVVSSYIDSPIDEPDLERLRLWYETLHAACIDRFSLVQNVFLLPQSTKRLRTGELHNGKICVEMRGIRVFPAAFEPRDHRTGATDNLAGTLTHEYFHQYMRIIGESLPSRQWMELGGWQLHNRYPELVDGQAEICSKEDMIESEYGRICSIEEFCDAAVKAIYRPDSFRDPAKLRYFEENFLRQRPFEHTESSIRKVESPSVPLPPKQYRMSFQVLK